MRTLLALLCLIPLTAAAEEGWREVMLDAHEVSIDAAHIRAHRALDQLAADAYGRSDAPAALALLDAPVRVTNHEALLGNWRCRSTQVDSSNGVFAYPAFRCVVELTEDGILVFTKTSGSQRRHGQIYPFGEGRWVFLGGQSVNDEPYRSYSGTQGDAAGADPSMDSVGLVETLKDGRVRMILDAQTDQVEFYELSR
ncbi:MAG TPA: DUF4893 domain-containing protein [Xanthomonadales bacterium]|nr:DUF4893 domain-containing protein [Xanthomonadales bacterium]